MTSEPNKISGVCPATDIAAYIDGELPPEAERALERHLSGCAVCAEELNIQKHLVNALSASLYNGPELPADFTKQIVTRAESGVAGLRHGRERRNAVIVSTALLSIALAGLGTSNNVFEAALRTYTVAAFVTHLIYNIAEGFVILLRAFLSQPRSAAPFAIGVVLLTAATGYLIARLRTNAHDDHLERGNIS